MTDGDPNASILLTIKKMLGLNPDYEDEYDTDIIVFINSAIMILTQLGVGSPDGFVLVTGKETWNDFLGDSETKIASVETYVYLKVKLAFDPPANSFVVNSMEKYAEALEWRINVRAEGVNHCAKV